MIKYIISLVILVFIFTACAKKNEPLYTTKIYKNIQNDYILNASKKVFLLADDRFRIDSQANSVTASRAIAKFKVYYADLEINNIYLTTKTDNDTVIAKLKITHKKDYFDKEELITNNEEHQLIWNRIDYILGLNKKWPKCLTHNLKLNHHSVLCDSIYNQNNKVKKSDIIVPKPYVKKETIKEEDILKDIELEDMSILDDSKTTIDTNTTLDQNSSNLINIDEIDDFKIEDTNETIKR
jgi:hypothetical protein